jgi:hypothetical protein
MAHLKIPPPLERPQEADLSPAFGNPLERAAKSFTADPVLLNLFNQVAPVYFGYRLGIDDMTGADVEQAIRGVHYEYGEKEGNRLLKRIFGAVNDSIAPEALDMLPASSSKPLMLDRARLAQSLEQIQSIINDLFEDYFPVPAIEESDFETLKKWGRSCDLAEDLGCMYLAFRSGRFLEPDVLAIERQLRKELGQFTGQELAKKIYKAVDGQIALLKPAKSRIISG